MKLIVTSDGILRVDERQYTCVIGKGGFKLNKREKAMEPHPLAHIT